MEVKNNNTRKADKAAGRFNFFNLILFNQLTIGLPIIDKTSAINIKNTIVEKNHSENATIVSSIEIMSILLFLFILK
jgi:ABC-type uncharacterized transport system ATPase subunit